MSIIEETNIISTDDVETLGITSLSNRPNIDDGLTAKDLKERFDALAKKAIESINAIIDAVNATDIADKIPLEGLDEIATLAALVNSVTNGTLYEKLTIKIGEKATSFDTYITKIKSDLEASDAELGERISGVIGEFGYTENDIGVELHWGTEDKQASDSYVIPIPKAYVKSFSATDPDNNNDIVELSWVSENGTSGSVEIPYIRLATSGERGYVPTYAQDGVLTASTPQNADEKALVNVGYLLGKLSEILQDVQNDIARTVSAVYKYKGTKESLADLKATTDHEDGDVWNIETEFELNGRRYPAGTNVVRNGLSWEVLSTSIDVESFLTKSDKTDAEYAYIRSYSSDTVMKITANDTSAGTIPKRDSYGNFLVRQSSQESHCATVGQVDNIAVSLVGVSQTVAANKISADQSITAINQALNSYQTEVSRTYVKKINQPTGTFVYSREGGEDTSTEATSAATAETIALRGTNGELKSSMSDNPEGEDVINYQYFLSVLGDIPSLIEKLHNGGFE